MISGAIKDIPVTFPPGRPRLMTSPVATGSTTADITMGIVLVAPSAALTAGVEFAMMMSTLRRMSSGARPGSRS